MNKQDWRDLIAFTKGELKKAKAAPTNSSRDELIKNLNIKNLQDDLDHSYMELKSFPEETRSYQLV